MRGFGLPFMIYHQEPSLTMLVVYRCLQSLMMMFFALICTLMVAFLLNVWLELDEWPGLLSSAVAGGLFWGFFLFQIWTGRLELHEHQ